MSANDDNNNNASPHRGSFASQRLSGLFGRSASIATSGTPAFPGPIAAAAHQAEQRRRMSIATVGLGASPSPSSPFGIRNRQDSLSSNGSALQGESAIDDSGEGSSPTHHGFGRRLSMGSKAMSNMASGSMLNGEGNGGGFNWSNEMRNRAQRSSSISSPTAGSNFSRFQKPASASAAASAPPPPPTIKQQTPPDHFQERILKGDFYMD